VVFTFTHKPVHSTFCLSLVATDNYVFFNEFVTEVTLVYSIIR